LKREPAILLLAAALAAAAPAFAQKRPSEQARDLLEEGRAYRKQEKWKLALDAFNTIAGTYADTDSADDALLEIGRYYMDVEGDTEKARQKFEQVTKQYSQSDGAPGAYYMLGRLALSRATTAAELEDALAQFNRVQKLYPRSEYVANALYASGLVHRKAGRLPEVIEVERRVVLEYPHSDAAPAAQFEIGRCYALLGEPRQAMEEFQQVRNRFPDGPWPGHAINRTTALYRLYGAGKPVFNLDPGYTLALGDMMKDVSAILMTPEGTLWIASGKTKSAIPVSPQGKAGATLALEDPQSLSLTPRSDIIVSGRLAVRLGPKDIKTFAVPGDKPGELVTLDRISAATVLPGGAFLIADEKRKRVYKYDDQLRYQGPFPDAKEREVSRIVLDGDGNIVLLDEADKSVRFFDPAGRPVRAIGARGTGYEVKHPVDLAVDFFRNTYVADADGAVYVFGANGQLLTALTGGELRRPRALTLDADGALLVYDDKAERILRYR
jgi:tetratricopeptide (TPR) repeat protein